MKREFFGYLWTKFDIMMPDPFQRVDRITRHYSLRIWAVKIFKSGRQGEAIVFRVDDGGYSAV